MQMAFRQNRMHPDVDYLLGLRTQVGPPAYLYSCQTPVASDPHKRARWNARDVNWQAFTEAAEEPVRSIQARDMQLQQSHDPR